MALTPVFNPDTGASGGPSPATPPAATNGAPKLVINTNFQASPTVDMSSVGTFTVDGVAWTTTAAVATTCEADSTGLVVSTDDATSTSVVCQIPDVAQGDFIGVAVVFSGITAQAANSSNFHIKLCSAAGTTTAAYDMLVTMHRVSSSSYRLRNGYRNSGNSSNVMAYVGDNPYASSLPSGFTLALWGSGYSWQTRCSSGTSMPDFRATTATNNAGGSLRTRGSGQLLSDSDPPKTDYLKIVFNSNGGAMAGKVTAVRVWVGARVV